MPRTRSPALTDAEARVMSVLWELGTATVADVVDGLRRKRAVT
jgi:predicted transcriptional regulator